MVCSNKKTYTDQELIDLAIDSMKYAYVPYSNFRVGAAVLSDGEVFTGCNIENAAYSATICAERTAISKAISSGHRRIEKIAIVGGKEGIIEDYCLPCGECRQVMSEFANKDLFEILLTNKDKKIKKYYLKDILPAIFDKNLL